MPPIRYCVMPKSGYKSITIPEELYDRFKSYKDNNSGYSLSKYISQMLEGRIIQDKAIHESNPIIKKIGSEKDTTVLRDYTTGQIVEVGVRQDTLGKPTLYCESCNSSRCIHCGFCYALPETYIMLKATR